MIPEMNALNRLVKIPEIPTNIMSHDSHEQDKVKRRKKKRNVDVSA